MVISFESLANKHIIHVRWLCHIFIQEVVRKLQEENHGQDVLIQQVIKALNIKVEEGNRVNDIQKEKGTSKFCSYKVKPV